MRFSSVAALAAIGAVAQAADSICDNYTQIVFLNNTPANQYTLLTVLVNTVVIGSYFKGPVPNKNLTFPNITVPGILAPGTVNGTAVNLLPYFDGGLASTNEGGKAVSVNWLDDGGATPLMMNMPANGTSSRQYALLTHLYQFFGTLLGCSGIAMNSTDFPKYQGEVSMYDVHKFMDLDNAQNTYFIEQVGMAAVSLGVTKDDATYVGGVLASVFNQRCAQPIALVSSEPELQAICIAADCPQAANATCAAYASATEPAVAISSLAAGLGNPSATGSIDTAKPTMSPTVVGSQTVTAAASGSGTASASASATGAAHHAVAPVAAAGLGLLAFLL